MRFGKLRGIRGGPGKDPKSKALFVAFPFSTFRTVSRGCNAVASSIVLVHRRLGMLVLSYDCGLCSVSGRMYGHLAVDLKTEKASLTTCSIQGIALLNVSTPITVVSPSMPKALQCQRLSLK